uniref:Uncharacterized protein n=1 Tax=Solanum tuberosum TaxID=4113 RepID=M1DDA0_SOLTU
MDQTGDDESLGSVGFANEIVVEEAPMDLGVAGAIHQSSEDIKRQTKVLSILENRIKVEEIAMVNGETAKDNGSSKIELEEMIGTTIEVQIYECVRSRPLITMMDTQEKYGLEEKKILDTTSRDSMRELIFKVDKLSTRVEVLEDKITTMQVAIDKERAKAKWNMNPMLRGYYDRAK